MRERDRVSRAAKHEELYSFDAIARHGVRGVPDGLTLDVDGNLWVACVHGGAIIRVDPRTGRLLQTVRLNVTNVSAAEWGGRNRDVLYVTSARYKMGKSQVRGRVR